MKTNYLFPAVFKKIGWVLFIFAVLFALFNNNVELLDTVVPPEWARLGWYQFITSSVFITNVVIISLIISLLFISFSREKDEDECIASIRSSSLVWAVIVNYALLIVATLAFNDLDYLSVMMYNMFTILILFVTKFSIALYRFRRTAND